MTRMEERSYRALTSSGSAHSMRTSAGAENVEVTLYLSTSRSQSSASNLRCTTMVWPNSRPMPMNAPGPLW